MKFFSPALKTLPFLSVLTFIMAGSNLTLESYPLLPSFFLIPVYYWVVFRPDWLPLWSLLGIGFFYDSLMGYTLGLSSILLMLSAVLAHYLRPLLNPQNFIFTWLIFGLYCLGYTLIYGLLVSGGMALFVTWAYTLVFYPIMARGLIHLHTWLQAHV